MQMGHMLITSVNMHPQSIPFLSLCTTHKDLSNLDNIDEPFDKDMSSNL